MNPSPNNTLQLCGAALLGIVLLSGAYALVAASEAPAPTPSNAIHAARFAYPTDARLTENPTGLDGGLAKVMRLLPVSFHWKGAPNGDEEIGFIAQEVETIVPEVVHTDGSGTKYVDYAKLLPVLITAVQEQEAELDELRAAVADLATTTTD